MLKSAGEGKFWFNGGSPLARGERGVGWSGPPFPLPCAKTNAHFIPWGKQSNSKNIFFECATEILEVLENAKEIMRLRIKASGHSVHGPMQIKVGENASITSESQQFAVQLRILAPNSAPQHSSHRPERTMLSPFRWADGGVAGWNWCVGRPHATASSRGTCSSSHAMLQYGGAPAGTPRPPPPPP